MKKILIILCALAVMPADAVPTVRRLGGAGTHNGTTNATASKVARTGTLRTSSVKPSATKQVKPTNNVARGATKSRLSIGKYLGGSTAVSGPINSGNNTSGGADVELAGDCADTVCSDVETLRQDMDTVQERVDGVEETIESMVDTRKDANQEMAGTYDVTGIMFVETPDLPIAVGEDK